MRFHDLPTEIRLKIYRFGLVDDEAVLCPQTRRSFGPSSDKTASCLAVLRANRATYNEAIGVLYGDSLIRYYIDLYPSDYEARPPIKGSETYLRSLRRLEICCKNPYTAMLSTLYLSGQLKRLTIRVENDHIELLAAFAYLMVHKCYLRELLLTLDFLKTGDELEKILVVTEKYIWQVLAALNVREKLVVKITTAQHRDTTEFKKHVDSFVDKLVSEKKWSVIHTIGDGGHPVWTWTSRPKISRELW